VRSGIDDWSWGLRQDELAALAGVSPRFVTLSSKANLRFGCQHGSGLPGCSGERDAAPGPGHRARRAVPRHDLHGQPSTNYNCRIFFLSTEKEPLLAERIRNDTRKQLIRSATKAIRRLAPDRDRAHAHVNGVAMVVLYEMAVRSHLGLTEPYRTLGPRRFRTELAKLSRVSTGFADEAAAPS
jgi:hypothetical protein